MALDNFLTLSGPHSPHQGSEGNAGVSLPPEPSPVLAHHLLSGMLMALGETVPHLESEQENTAWKVVGV